MGSRRGQIIDVEFEVVRPARTAIAPPPISLWARIRGRAFWLYYVGYFVWAAWWVATHP